MAVRLSATGQDFTRALSLGSLTALTASFWWKVSVDRNTYSTSFFVENGQADNIGVQTGVDGTTANVILDGNSTASVAMTVGAYYFGCLAVSGTTGTFYYKAAGGTSLSTTAITGVTATNGATLRLGESPWGSEWLNGCIAAFKLWNAQLTQAEIELEAAQYVPNRFTNLVSWHPLVKTETTDYSGNARTLSGGTGTTTEDGPPIPWKLASPRVTTPVSSGISGTAAPTQAADTASASGVLGYTGTVARSQAAQTSAASGAVINPVTGTSAATQAANTSTASGILGYSGTSAATQASQTSTASGTVAAGISGTAAVTQANQTAAASGILGYAGSAAPSQGAQTSTATGQLGYTGIVTGSQAANTAAASGSVGAAGSFTGTAAPTQAGHTSTASGILGYTGTSTAQDAADVSSAAGTVVNPVTGTGSPAQQGQFSIANGVLRYTGTATPTQAAHVSAASGVVANPVTGTAVTAQARQVAAGTGQFAGLVTFGTATAATGPVPMASAVNAPAATAKSASMTVPTATGG